MSFTLLLEFEFAQDVKRKTTENMMNSLSIL